jgi:prophage regulatory protein
MSEASPTSLRVLRDPEVRKRTGLSRVQRWRRIRSGTFPSAIQLGPNRIGWDEDEIETWLAGRPRVSYAPPQTAAPESILTARPPRGRRQEGKGGT